MCHRTSVLFYLSMFGSIEPLVNLGSSRGPFVDHPHGFAVSIEAHSYPDLFANMRFAWPVSSEVSLTTSLSPWMILLIVASRILGPIFDRHLSTMIMCVFTRFTHFSTRFAGPHYSFVIAGDLFELHGNDQSQLQRLIRARR